MPNKCVSFALSNYDAAPRTTGKPEDAADRQGIFTEGNEDNEDEKAF